MHEVLEDYSVAFENHVEAERSEMKSKLLVQSTHYALVKARDRLKDKEKELLADIETYGR